MTSESQIFGHVPDLHVLAGAAQIAILQQSEHHITNFDAGSAWYDVKILVLI
jgi:hypothetical protein